MPTGYPRSTHPELYKDATTKARKRRRKRRFQPQVVHDYEPNDGIISMAKQSIEMGLKAVEEGLKIIFEALNR